MAPCLSRQIKCISSTCIKLHNTTQASWGLSNAWSSSNIVTTQTGEEQRSTSMYRGAKSSMQFLDWKTNLFPLNPCNEWVKNEAWYSPFGSSLTTSKPFRHTTFPVAASTNTREGTLVTLYLFQSFIYKRKDIDWDETGNQKDIQKEYD